MKFTVYMIVKNEESCLDKCLESVREADEIVVVDTGSTDQTESVARKHTASFFTGYKWNDNFAEARNEAMSKTTGDWLLSIDADEVLEVGGISKCREAILLAEQQGCRTVGCRCTSMRGGEVHNFPRLHKRCPEVFWKGAIHNYLSVVETNASDITIFYGYSGAHKADPDRALRILTKEVEWNPACVREKFYLAREFWYRANFPEAIKWYWEYIKVAYWPPEKADALLMLARCYLKVGDRQSALGCCLRAVSTNTHFKEAILLLAELSGPKNQKRWREFAETATNEDVLFKRVS